MNTCSSNVSSEFTNKLKEQAHQFRRDYIDFWVKNMNPLFMSSKDKLLVALNNLIETITDFETLFTPPQDDIISELKGVGDDLFDQKRFGQNAVVNKAIKLIEKETGL